MRQISQRPVPPEGRPRRRTAGAIIETGHGGGGVPSLRPSLDDLDVWIVADGPSNVALFVSFVRCTGLLLCRPLAAFVVGVALSVLVESYQAGTGTRVGASADVVSNSIGALVGAGLAALVLVVSHASRASDDGPDGGR